MILHLKQVLTPAELSSIHEVLRGAEWQAGRDSAGAQAASIKNNEQLSHQSGPMIDIRQRVLAALDRHPEFFSATLPRRVFPPRVNRYGGESNFFGNHVDNAIRFAPDTGLRVRTDISCTLFLAEPSAYEGGELIFQESNTQRHVKLPAGDAIIYPGTTLHRVAPVTRGYRLACFFWVESMVRENDRRQLLFELDRSIVRLREAYGDNEHSVALTGTYHNLLRQWCDT
ncbi:MAG: Fe2+-dependent dioxygenase [Burkholderiales bacterium]|nr:MAG: Fe2+-dependent dioxygenase [Burkholderiales bacterium]TAG79340.1 MAG: Fe2+-dependent dioxygenase [Betaproteobacteria bacterium]